MTKTPTFLEWLQTRRLQIDIYIADDELNASLPLLIEGERSIACLIRRPLETYESMRKQITDLIMNLETHMTKHRTRLVYPMPHQQTRLPLNTIWSPVTTEEIRENFYDFFR